MSLLQRSAIVTAMLAALSVPVLSQSAAAADAPAAAPTHEAHGGKHHRPDPKQMEARMEKRLQALKTALKLSGDQEAAWTTYTAAIKPQRPAAGERPERPDHKALAAMTTPERIDAMQALHSKRHAEMQARMDQRNQATKTFYAALNAEQKKTFDAETLKMHERPGHGPRGDGPGPRGGQRPAPDSK